MEMMWDYNYMYFLPLATLLTILLVHCCIMMVRCWWKKAALKKKIKTKKDECRESLENLASGHRVTDGQSQESEIVDLPMEKLLEKLKSGEYGAKDVLREYQQKAYEVNKEFNCVVEPIKEAEDLATECDNTRNSTEQHQRPLHGLPVSLKENYFLKGYDCTAGMSDYIGKPCNEDAVIVQVLKKQGAVPFVRTNLPQTMMIYECSNPIYGQTVNPHDRTRGPGGSSGGEGCIIGAKGSPLGFGSDIGGSIRIPSHMCGVCGLKPTYGRLSVKGTHELGQGQTLINATTGPMARDVTSLVIAMKALLCDDMFDLDPTVPPIPFRTEVDGNSFLITTFE